MKETGDLLYLRHKRCVGFDFCNGNLSHCITSYWILESLVKFGNVRKCLCAPRRMSANLNKQSEVFGKLSEKGGGGGVALPYIRLASLSYPPFLFVKLGDV